MDRESAHTLALELLGRRVRVTCGDAEIAALFPRCFGRLLACAASAPADLEYRVHRTGDGFLIERPGQEALAAADEGELLFAFESDLTPGLQRLRPDLFFLHAGAVATPQGAALLVGDSGAGKSTLTWSLVRRGFPYLSDELAPVALPGLRVHAYPRAVALKELPPPPLGVPPGALRTSFGLRVPVDAVGDYAAPAPRRICAIFFLDPVPAPPGKPTARRTGVAESAARLLANALNPRAHPADGLDAALAIARTAAGFELRRGDLQATCDLVQATLEDLDPRLASAPRPGD